MPNGGHKIVRVRPHDWPLQACQVYPGRLVYLDLCGTFGVSSAAYWWCQLAAAIQRSGLYILGPLLPLWILLFADDWNLTAEGRNFARCLLAYVWWLVVLGVPVSWKKSRGGLCYTWVGYELSLRDWTLGVSASRAGWIRSWYERTLKTRTVDTGELREVWVGSSSSTGPWFTTGLSWPLFTHSWRSPRRGCKTPSLLCADSYQVVTCSHQGKARASREEPI